MRYREIIKESSHVFWQDAVETLDDFEHDLINYTSANNIAGIETIKTKSEGMLSFLDTFTIVEDEDDRDLITATIIGFKELIQRSTDSINRINQKKPN